MIHYFIGHKVKRVTMCGEDIFDPTIVTNSHPTVVDCIKCVTLLSNRKACPSDWRTRKTNAKWLVRLLELQEITKKKARLL